MFNEPVGTQLFQDIEGLKTATPMTSREQPSRFQSISYKTTEHKALREQMERERLARNFVSPAEIKRQIIKHACDHYNVDPKHIMTRYRGSNTVCRARHMAVYLVKEIVGENLNLLGRTFGRDHSTIRHGIKVVERNHIGLADDLIESFGVVTPEQDH